METAESEKRALRRVVLGYFIVALGYGVAQVLLWLRDPQAEVRHHPYVNYLLFGTGACSLPLIWMFQGAGARARKRITMPRATATITAALANGIALCGLVDFLVSRSPDWAVALGLLAGVGFASVFVSLPALRRRVEAIAAAGSAPPPGEPEE